MTRLAVTPRTALELWHEVALDVVHDGKLDLNQRQLAILLTIYLEPPPHTVRGLAAKLKVTKPVITRALDTMSRMGLVERKRDEQDRRNVMVARTVEGAMFLERLADIITTKANQLG